MILLNRPSLQNLVEKKDLIGAEVGVRTGINAKNILKKLDIKKLYLIDTWKNSPIASKENTIKNLKKFKNKIIILSGKSSEMYKNIKDDELDFVYIDAGHSYEHVQSDIKNYYPKVKTGGLIAGHDYNKKHTKLIEAVNDYFGKENIKSNVCLDSIAVDWWIWKT